MTGRPRPTTSSRSARTVERHHCSRTLRWSRCRAARNPRTSGARRRSPRTGTRCPAVWRGGDGLHQVGKPMLPTPSVTLAAAAGVPLMLPGSIEVAASSGMPVGCSAGHVAPPFGHPMVHDLLHAGDATHAHPIRCTSRVASSVSRRTRRGPLDGGRDRRRSARWADHWCTLAIAALFPWWGFSGSARSSSWG